MSGAFSIAVAIFVSGPNGHNVIVPASLVRIVSIIKSTACCFWRGILGSGRVGPSSQSSHEHAPLLQVVFALGCHSLQKPLSQFFVLTRKLSVRFFVKSREHYLLLQ